MILYLSSLLIPDEKAKEEIAWILASIYDPGTITQIVITN